MSNFTYEIDERNLRIQMKEFIVPVKEDAWQKFETFSDSMVNKHRENRLKNFNFSLNRGVVLPSVFGVIIILFSFLLVNFVSIKNPSKVNDQKAEIKPVPIPTPEPTTQPKVEKVAPVVVVEKKSEVQANVMPAVPEIKTEEKNTKPAAEINQGAIMLPLTESTETITNMTAEEAKAKRRAERRAIRAVENQKLQEIRPTPVSEEGDSEIRPD